MPTTRHIESLVSLLIIVVSAAVIYESSKLPPGSFDPLGSGTMPAITAWTLIALCAAILVRPMLFRDGPMKERVGDEAEGEASGRTTGHAIAFAAATLAYVVVLDLKLAHFIPVTVAFLMLSLLILNGVSRRGVVICMAVSVIFPVLIFLCFTEIFIVDLPGAF